MYGAYHALLLISLNGVAKAESKGIFEPSRMIFKNSARFTSLLGLKLPSEYPSRIPVLSRYVMAVKFLLSVLTSVKEAKAVEILRLPRTILVSIALAIIFFMFCVVFSLLIVHDLKILEKF